jgi:hypothetical protein
VSIVVRIATCLVLVLLSAPGWAHGQARKKADPDVERWVRRIHSRDADVKAEATDKLKALHEEGKPVVHRLCAQVAQLKPAAAAAAIEALRVIEPDLAGPASRLMIRAPRPDAGQLASMSAWADQLDAFVPALEELNELGAKAAPLTPLVAAALSDCFSTPRINPPYKPVQLCVAVLGNVAAIDEMALRIMMDSACLEPLRDQSQIILVQGAIYALGKAGEENPKLRKKIMPILLARLSQPQTRAVLSNPMSISAAYAVARFGKDAKAALPTLQALTGHRNTLVQQAAQKAIEAIGAP